jgi:osmotically-inducible protein OsmY/sporulation protein YlmC with PRC-barrel domain
MQNTKMIIAAVGVAGFATLHLAAQSAGAPYQAYPQSGQSYSGGQVASMSPNLKASTIIGMPVRNESGEHLGRVKDLVVNMESDSVPVAIIEYGGALGVGDTRIAVPLRDLRWSGQRPGLMLAASKEQFDAAASTPTGRWQGLAGQEWIKDVDRFYGQPQFTGQARFERQEYGTGSGRETVRTPADSVGPGSRQNQDTGRSGEAVTTMTRPADQQLAAQINALVQQNVQNGSRNIQVVIRNGGVTLRGRIPTDEQKQLLEKQIKALPGVDRVQDSMITGYE